MNTSLLASRTTSLNAKVGAATLAAGALLILLLSHFSAALAPLRLLALAMAVFAAWSFCDEMGMRRPLNRAGFVFFAIAATAKVHIVVGVSAEFAGRYHLLYATFLLAAMLFWSVAFLHRQRTLKVVGAVGVLASLAPIIAVVAGHVAVGTGAFLGIGALLSATEGAAPFDHAFVTLIERMFGLWGCLTAWLLWRGHIRSTTPTL